MYNYAPCVKNSYIHVYVITKDRNSFNKKDIKLLLSLNDERAITLTKLTAASQC